MCQHARSVQGARQLVDVEHRLVRWESVDELAGELGVGPAELYAHARFFSLLDARLDHLEDAAALALARALAGDPRARDALSALDRLRELRAGQPAREPAEPDDDGPDDGMTWEQMVRAAD